MAGRRRATFGLVTTILGGVRHRPDAVPVLVWALHNGRLLVYRFNKFRQPCRDAGAQFTDSFSGIQPADMPAFVLAQFLARWWRRQWLLGFFRAPCQRTVAHIDLCRLPLPH